MPVSSIKKYIIFCLAGLLFTFSSGSAQSFRFNNYLPETYVYSISQESNGFLWIGTGNGLLKFDGFSFYPVVFPDSVEYRITNVLYNDSRGRLWMGMNDGSLFYSSENQIIRIPDLGVQSISDIFETSEGNIIVIPQNKYIFSISPDDPKKITRYSVSSEILMTTGTITPEKHLLLGTTENLLDCLLENDSVSVKQVIEGIEYVKVQSVRQLKNAAIYLVGTEDDGLFRLKYSGEIPVLDRFPGYPSLESLDIKSIYEDSESNVWMGTEGNGLLKITFTGEGSSISGYQEYTSGSGLVSENVRTVFKDMEGNLWLGFYGDGMSMLSSNAFSFYSPGRTAELNNIIYIKEDNKKYFVGTPKGYYFFNPETGLADSFTDLTAVTGTENISCYYLDKNRDLWIGTNGKGLFLKGLNGGTRLFFLSQNTAEDKIRSISSDGSNLWLSTLDGIVIVNKVTGAVIRKLKREDRLPHNSINQVFFRSDGKALPATECDRTYTISLDEGISTDNNIMQGEIKNKVLCFTETLDGTLLAGTEGNGIFYFRNDTVKRITTRDGMASNYCYSLITDRENRVWAGHYRAFSRIDINTGAVSSFSTDFAGGGDCNNNALFIDSNGRVLIGTTGGLIVYDIREDRTERIPPKSNIVAVYIDNVMQPLQKSYYLPYSNYTFRIDYVGINLSEPGSILYKTRMDNLNDKWSAEKNSRSVEYPLRDGRYRFSLISVSDYGLTDNTPVSIDIFIKKPFWRTWWFILIIAGTATGIVVIIVRERDKAQRKIKEYLETELAARTQLVMKQKDEIEMQNIEITDSINYAKRIQSSILPDNSRLKETFSDAFILFHPRDIVSGDFYWFDRISDEKFILVCADSTGHGVPGAFMSMIGSTLLQDIISRKGVTRPSQILSMLDKQIFSTLNQNVDVGVSNDGMDMVVCEINTKTKHVRFASAMRPVIIVMGGESYYIKGNRCSVGGESVVEKYFDDQEYYLNARDSIYMFSDGLPDQFGGSDGKKLKIARLKKLIEDMHNLTMSEQKELISDFYFDWKGDYEQVDDILLMGIRL